MTNLELKLLKTKQLARVLLISTVGIVAPMPSFADTDISLPASYNITVGINGNSQNYDKQTFQVLTKHEGIKTKLLEIQHASKKILDVGPVVKNGNNNGLIDIDILLAPTLAVNTGICGADNLEPTVREAVVCTVNDGGRGNTVRANVGFSTQGRELWGVRLGNNNGMKVLIITQQHGNEVQSTEAALKFIKHLAQAKGADLSHLLARLNILFIVRANPDGGEPSADCYIGTPLGQVIAEDCAITRTNVDPQAGGGLIMNSEADFSGTVGVGYNLNRYHFVDLMRPIRPVETQAMVAVALAWRPEVVLDLHGDIGKTSCTIDLSSITIIPGVGLPSAQCAVGSDQDPVVLSPFEHTKVDDEAKKIKRSRTLAANIARSVEESGIGVVNRFAQIRTGSGVINGGDTAEYEKIGALVSGWESLNFIDAVSLSVQSVQNGVPRLGLIPEWFLGNKGNGNNTRLNEIALEQALNTISGWAVEEPIDEAGYCDIPLTTAIIAALPEEIFGAVPGYGPYLVPLLGPLRQVFDSCPANL